MSTHIRSRVLPSWVLPAALIAGVLFLIFLGWRALTGGDEPVGPPRVIHAGQYNIMAEIRKVRAAEGRSGTDAHPR